MGIIASITGANNINLDLYQVKDVRYRHSIPVTSYAKSNDATFELVLYMNADWISEKSPDTVKSLREWENEPADSDTYYRNVEISEIYGDNTVRVFTFPQAFVHMSHTNTINDGSQSQTIELVLYQKRDKFKEITIS